MVKASHARANPQADLEVFIVLPGQEKPMAWLGRWGYWKTKNMTQLTAVPLVYHMGQN